MGMFGERGGKAMGRMRGGCGGLAMAMVRVAKCSGEFGCIPDRAPVLLAIAPDTIIDPVYVDALAMVYSPAVKCAHLWYWPSRQRYHSGHDNCTGSVFVYQMECWT